MCKIENYWIWCRRSCWNQWFQQLLLHQDMSKLF